MHRVADAGDAAGAAGKAGEHASAVKADAGDIAGEAPDDAAEQPACLRWPFAEGLDESRLPRSARAEHHDSLALELFPIESNLSRQEGLKLAQHRHLVRLRVRAKERAHPARAGHTREVRLHDRKLAHRLRQVPSQAPRLILGVGRLAGRGRERDAQEKCWPLGLRPVQPLTQQRRRVDLKDRCTEPAATPAQGTQLACARQDALDHARREHGLLGDDEVLEAHERGVLEHRVALKRLRRVVGDQLVARVDAVAVDGHHVAERHAAELELDLLSLWNYLAAKVTRILQQAQRNLNLDLQHEHHVGVVHRQRQQRALKPTIELDAQTHRGVSH